MGRKLGHGAGQSSLGYLFGGSQTPISTPNTNEAPLDKREASPDKREAATENKSQKCSTLEEAVDVKERIPAGLSGNLTNNYPRALGQNRGNFITDRPSTKVHAAPGGRSSLGYLFGGE